MTDRPGLITHTDFVFLPITSFERSEEFYAGVLGLPLSTRYRNGIGGAFEMGNLTTPHRESYPGGATADPDSPLGLCIRYRDAFLARDVDALMALVKPDFVFENVTGGERVEGIDAARTLSPE